MGKKLKGGEKKKNPAFTFYAFNSSQYFVSLTDRTLHYTEEPRNPSIGEFYVAQKRRTDIVELFRRE